MNLTGIEIICKTPPQFVPFPFLFLAVSPKAGEYSINIHLNWSSVQ